jgi:hypothetical protein
MKKGRWCRPTLEVLKQRINPDTMGWMGGSLSGNTWTVANNWYDQTLGQVAGWAPGRSDVAVFPPTGSGGTIHYGATDCIVNSAVACNSIDIQQNYAHALQVQAGGSLQIINDSSVSTFESGTKVYLFADSSSPGAIIVDNSELYAEGSVSKYDTSEGMMPQIAVCDGGYLVAKWDGVTGHQDPSLGCNIDVSWNPMTGQTSTGEFDVGLTQGGVLMNQGGTQVTANWGGIVDFGWLPTKSAVCSLVSGNTTPTPKLNIYGGKLYVNGYGSPTLGYDQCSLPLDIDRNGSMRVMYPNQFEEEAAATMEYGQIQLDSSTTTLFDSGLTINGGSHAANTYILFAGTGTVKIGVDGTTGLNVQNADVYIGQASSDYTFVNVVGNNNLVTFGSGATVVVNCNLASSSQCGHMSGCQIVVNAGANVKLEGFGTWNKTMDEYAFLTASQSFSGDFGAGNWIFINFPPNPTHFKGGNGDMAIVSP